jgi:ubiquinone/menaquinone biosynthesis C-methylase UbiE
MATVKWDYTDRAEHYDKRADYSQEAVETVLHKIGAVPGKPVADIGAGTGKLTKLLALNGLTVRAIEPNDAMMAIGIKNTEGMSVTWTRGVGEKTDLPDSSVHAAFFGSSFNVLDQKAALFEVARILVPDGYFVCMWNHRDLNDRLQNEIEEIIRQMVPGYNYGSRREDPTATIDESKLFGQVSYLEQNFKVEMLSNIFFEGWKSHATLARQAGQKFASVLERIQELLTRYEFINVPYSTKIWFAPLAVVKTGPRSCPPSERPSSRRRLAGG